MVSLPSLLDDCEGTISLLKVDVEGAEWEIDWRDEATLQQVERICMEIHPVGGRSKDRLLSILVAEGFAVVRRKDRPGGTCVVWLTR